MSSTEVARLREAERQGLARDLSDAVTHQLATVSLQVMGYLDCDDADQLQVALQRIGRAADSALVELRTLVRVLRDGVEPGHRDGADALSMVVPTELARRWSRRLTLAGFVPLIDVPAESDRVEISARQTICRVLDVGGQGAVSSAAPRSAFIASVAVQPELITVHATLQPSAEHLAGSLDQTALGLRERVDLTGGTVVTGLQSFAAGRRWVIAITLPRG